MAQQTSTVRVKANRHILGLRPGTVGEVDNTRYVQQAIKAGYLEKVGKDAESGQDTVADTTTTGAT